MERGRKHGKEGLSTDVERFGIKYLLKNALEHDLKGPGRPSDGRSLRSSNHCQRSINIMLKLGISGG